MVNTPGVVYADAILIDTSAVVALLDPADQFHNQAKAFYSASAHTGTVWAAVNTTSHEAFTRVRYGKTAGSRKSVAFALQHYDFLRTNLHLLTFNDSHENRARVALAKYSDQVLSFHDALAAMVSIEAGIYQVFSFDRDYWILGLQVLPGETDTYK